MAKNKNHRARGKGQGSKSMGMDGVHPMLHNQRFDRTLLVAVGLLLLVGGEERSGTGGNG